MSIDTSLGSRLLNGGNTSENRCTLTCQDVVIATGQTRKWCSDTINSFVKLGANTYQDFKIIEVTEAAK